MIQRTLRYIPLSEAPNSEAERAAAGLVGLATGGGIVADTMGLGKTFLALFFINFTAHSQRPPLHKPHLVLAPNGVVLSQWLQAIYQNFPDLAIVLTHEERPSDPKYVNCWVPAHAMR